MIHPMKTLIATLTVALLGCTLAFAESGVPKSYPLTNGVISDEKLGDHGKPVKVTEDGTDVWLCCKSCIKDFKKAQAKYVKMVKDAEAKKK